MSDKLFLGVAREIITPSLGIYLGGYPFPDRFATSVNDDLTVTVFSFKYSDTKSMIVSATLTCLDETICDEIRNKIEAETDVPANNIIIHTTHTHSSPVTFTSDGWGAPDRKYLDEIVIPRTVLAAKCAVGNEQYVKMGIAQGKSLVGVNRREPSQIKNGIKLGIWEYGCFDPKMTVLSFKNYEGVCVGNIIHYGCHATGCGASLEITRDWPGIMTDRVEKISGGITAFINGPEGDVGPRLSNGRTTGEGDIGYMKEQGDIAAHDAVEIYNSIDVYRDVEMKCISRNIRLPLEAIMPREEAEKKLSEIEVVNSITSRTANIYKGIIKLHDEGHGNVEFKEHRQTAIRIGDVAFVAHPFETFSEIGLRINIMSKIPYALTVALANGCISYFPTVGEIPKGGYEVTMFKTHAVQTYTNDADWALITESVKILEELL